MAKAATLIPYAGKRTIKVSRAFSRHNKRLSIVAENGEIDLDLLLKRYRLRVEVAPGQCIKSNPLRMIFNNVIFDVCDKYNVSRNDLLSPRRLRNLTIPRQEAYARMKAAADISLPRIGKMFGGRDHTTILHGIRQHQARIDAGMVEP